MKILIADDSDLIRRSLKRSLLSINGALQISEAKNAKQTMQLFNQLHPNLIILDIRMPDGNGIDTLNEIKKANPNQKVMMFTNYPSDLNRKKCTAAGADYFFDKADNFENVYAAVNDLYCKSLLK